MAHFERTNDSTHIFTGRVFSVHQDSVTLENGSGATRDVVEHHGGVCVVPIDEQDNVLLVRQFRYPFGRELLEVPAGKLEQGEDPAACGLRELREETGCTARVYEPVGCLYPSPAYLTEIIYMFYATGLESVGQKLDEDEFLDVVRVPFERAVEMVLAGEIPDAKTQIALLRLDAMRRRGT